MGHRILLSTLFEMLQTVNLREVHNQTETGTELNNLKMEMEQNVKTCPI